MTTCFPRSSSATINATTTPQQSTNLHTACIFQYNTHSTHMYLRNKSTSPAQGCLELNTWIVGIVGVATHTLRKTLSTFFKMILRPVCSRSKIWRAARVGRRLLCICAYEAPRPGQDHRCTEDWKKAKTGRYECWMHRGSPETRQ